MMNFNYIRCQKYDSVDSGKEEIATPPAGVRNDGMEQCSLSVITRSVSDVVISSFSLSVSIKSGGGMEMSALTSKALTNKT
ncbi:MAG: hypothetical protein HQK88_03255 [Nitrospirae bacterium]|nr:hypothetical protein [Nitrospirota bacterium]MBF0536248.1 hypothetical protein [Nitrospirota bacterium]MBF0615818.1 hypothetical protein [Nitrospirota bacterium]